MLSPTAQRALDFYGGAACWNDATAVEAEVSVTGLAFTLKRRPFFDHARLRMEVARPVSQLTPIGKDPGLTGCLNGADVWLADAQGNKTVERRNARSFFPYGRRLLYWDDLDMVYFANYAFWNYFTFPKLLLNETIRWTEKQPGMLEATFPDTLPTHSRIQEFHFDTVTGQLLQHNYTADVISGLARAAHVIHAHKVINGLNIPVSRVVTPQTGSGRALKRPVLIAITVHDFRVIPA